jgi:predicted GNAT family N-acyltransferase
MDPQIREARPGDEAAIHEAHMRSIREVCVKDHGEDEIKGWGYRPLGNRWIDAIKNGFVWVIECEQKVFGLAYIRIFEEDGETHANIHGLYLTPEVLGKGFGSKLMRIMLDKARASQVKKVTLQSSITAHEFYKHFGFDDCGSKMRVEIGGHPVTCFPMMLQL